MLFESGVVTATPDVPPPPETVIGTLVYDAVPHLSHSSTTVPYEPGVSESVVFSFAPLTTYVSLLLT